MPLVVLLEILNLVLFPDDAPEQSISQGPPHSTESHTILTGSTAALFSHYVQLDDILLHFKADCCPSSFADLSANPLKLSLNCDRFTRLIPLIHTCFGFDQALLVLRNGH